MAGTAVAPPMASAGQQPQFSNPGVYTGGNFQTPRMQTTPDVSQRGPRPFHRPYQFRPRYPMNKGGEEDSGMYDGKRMRKAIHRKTVDYNPSVIKFLQNRVWQRDARDEHRLQPDSLYSTDLIPPSALLDDPLNCVNTKFVRTSTNKFRCPIFCLTWTPEGRRLVTGASSGEFTLWNGLTFNFETILQAHETAVRAMRWSHSDGWMVTADHAGYIKYWQSNMNNVKMFQAHKEPIRGISFCPTDSKFASCSDDGTVRVWDFMRCHEERILRGHGADVRCVDWHPQKSLIASGSKDNQQPVKLWDPRTGNSLATLHAHKHTVMDLKWHHNGNWMLTASRDHLLKLFDTRNLKEELQTFKGHKREATAIGWHPIHEGLFASGSADGALMFWMVGCDHEVGGMEQAHEGMIWSLAWHPLGHILASGSNDHATKFWTRNRPGDEMRDKYNLNLLPAGLVDTTDTTDPGVEAESITPNLPGMGLEHGVAEHLQVKAEKKDENELPAIPGLNWEEDSILLKAEERAANKKVPYARPVPKMFEQAWAGEIDMEQIKKEQQAKAQAKQQVPPMNQPTLLLAQQMIGALTGALRQQLAGLPGGHMLLRPGGPLMLGNPLMRPMQPGSGAGPGGPMLLIPRPVGPAGQSQQGPGAAPQSGDGNGNGAGASNAPNGNAGLQMQNPPPSGNQNSQLGAVDEAGNAGGSKLSQVPKPADGSDQTGLQVTATGAPQNRMGGPLGPMSGHLQGQIGGLPPQGQMGGPPQGQILGPPPGQIGVSPQGQIRGPPPGQMSGPPQGQIRGPSQGQIGGPPQSQIRGPPPGQMVGPPQGQIRGPSHGQIGGLPQARMSGPPQHPIGGQLQGQIRRPPGPPNQPPGPRPQHPPFQGPHGDQRGGRGGESEEMDTDERFNMHGPGRGSQHSEMDEDFRAPARVYNGPARPPTFSGDQDQDLRQHPPPSHPHHAKFKQGPPPQRPHKSQAGAGGGGGGGGGYDNYGDMDERMGDNTGDYDYRREAGGMGRGRGGRGRGGAPAYNEGFRHHRHQQHQPGGYGRNYDAGDGAAEYDESGEYHEQEAGGWDHGGDQGGNSYNEGYYEDYDDNGYKESYQEPEARPPVPPPGRKRVWEEGPGQERGRGRGGRGGWGRGVAGNSWGRGGPRGGFRGAPRGGGFRGGPRGGPWHRGGPGGDRGSGRGRGGHRGGY